MDYLEIVLQGYFNENNRRFLNEYFYSEFKKAERDHFINIDRFINGCLLITTEWEKDIEKKTNARYRELILMKIGAKKGTMTYGEESKGKPLELLHQETIEYCEREMINLRKDGVGALSFTANLFRLTNNRIAYNIGCEEIQIIKNAINSAFNQTNENGNSTPPPQSLTLSLMITHENSEKIVANLKTQFKNISGKQLKLLLLALQELNLLPNERIAKKFHKSCNNDFDWQIGSYNAMNGYKYNESIDKKDLDFIKDYIKTIIS